MTETNKDAPVDGAQPRSPELVDALEEVKDTPPEPGGDWPDIGQPGGEARVGDDHGLSQSDEHDDDDGENHQGPLSQTGGGQSGG